MEQNILRVWVVKKVRDKNGIIQSCVIQNDDNPSEILQVSKAALKARVLAGTCKMMNMEITTDGRLVGTEKSKPVRRRTGCNLIEIYTNGKKVIGGLVDRSNYYRARKVAPEQLIGVQEGYIFEDGLYVQAKMQKLRYDNVNKQGDKLELGNIKKKRFSSIKNRMIKVIEDNGVEVEFEVEKGESKGDYLVRLKQPVASETLTSIIHMLIANAMTDAKIKVIKQSNGDTIVNSLTGLADVRKAVKAATIKDKEVEKKK